MDLPPCAAMTNSGQRCKLKVTAFGEVKCRIHGSKAPKRQAVKHRIQGPNWGLIFFQMAKIRFDDLSYEDCLPLVDAMNWLASFQLAQREESDRALRIWMDQDDYDHSHAAILVRFLGVECMTWLRELHWAYSSEERCHRLKLAFEQFLIPHQKSEK